MSRLVLGHYTRGEDKCNENKALHLLPHTLVNLHDDDIFDLVEDGLWTDEFRLVVENNVSEFISLILPKYVTCWANAKVDGVLNIGVDDSCEITGVPFLGEIPREKIKSSLTKTLQDNIKTKVSLEELNKMIEIEYQELDCDLDILSRDSERYMKKFSQDIRDYYDKQDKYLIEHAQFLIRHRQYTQKLETMLNTTRYRLELSKYIGEDSEKNQGVIDLLQSSKYIRLKQDNIHEDRENRNRVFYWIAKFRDEKSHSIGEKKPERPLYPSLYHFRQIVSNLPCMRHKFLSVNPNLKYYMIKIKCRVGQIDDRVEYRDPYSDRWLYRTRISQVEISDDKQSGPGCI